MRVNRPPRGYEFLRPTPQCLRRDFRATGMLCFQNEYSDSVWMPRLYYKAFAETKPAWTSMQEGTAMMRESEHAQLVEGSPEPEFAALVGIDWGDREHVWCLQVKGST